MHTIEVNKEVSMLCHDDYVVVKSQHAMVGEELQRLIDRDFRQDGHKYWELRKLYPEDWKLVMKQEQYGRFLYPGSPQVIECGWEIHYIYKGSGTSIEFHGLK